MKLSSDRMSLSIPQVIDSMLEGVMVTDHSANIIAVKPPVG